MTAERSEERLVAWLRTLTAPQGAHGRSSLGRSAIGDDTATLPRGAVVTLDQQIEGVHFPSGLAPDVVARRLLAVNLSDLAASGARPRYAFLALAAPSGFDHKSLFRALVAACTAHGVELAGGDLAQAPHLHLALTLIGDRRPGSCTLARNLARPGQTLWIGGTLGESALGFELVRLGARLRGNTVELPALFLPKGKLRRAATCAVRRHLLPSPQLGLGAWLARQGKRAAIAAIDVSDGLAKDLHRLCAASRVGARLDFPAVRRATAPEFVELAERLGLDPDRLVLGGGEDYVLLFSLPKRTFPPRRFSALAIGEATSASGVLVDDPALSTGLKPLVPAGWDHLGDPSGLSARRASRGAGRDDRSGRRRGN